MEDTGCVPGGPGGPNVQDKWIIRMGEFGWALEWLKRGAKVQRKGWNGKNMWIHLQRPDENSKMTLPYIYMYTAQGDLIPWLASQMDILAEDWQRAE